MLSERMVTLSRNLALGVTGVTCVGFAGLVVANAVPWPGLHWLPAAVGLGAAVFICLAALAGGERVVDVVWDEGSRQDWARALTAGYWLAILLYPLFALLLWQRAVTYEQALPAMGTLTGGLPLLYFCYLDWQGR